MTVCVVHRDGWAVTDSREMIGMTIVPTKPKKAFRSASGWYLITAAGPSSLCQKIEKAVSTVSDGETIEAITTILDEQDRKDVQVLLVDKEKNLINFDCDGCTSEIEQGHDFRVIGSGQDVVIGYLGAIERREKRKVTAEDAIEAITFAAALETSIDSRCQIVRLNG